MKNPLPRLTRRRFLSALLLLALVLAVAVPVFYYWALQRSDAHQRWQIESNYASQFGFQMGYAASLIAGIPFKWDNATGSFAGNEMGYADDSLVYISYFDTTHANQILRINYAIEGIRPQIPVANLSYSQRTSLSGQLQTLAVKIEKAYSNFVNYTSTSPAVGPPFWYSGPSPPDERLLQEAVDVALSLNLG